VNLVEKTLAFEPLKINIHVMKRPILLTGLCAIVLSRAAWGADTYKIDPVHSTVGFAVSHMVINTVKGKFDEFNGTLTMADGQVQTTEGTIQTKSVNTGVAARDKDLRSANFFDVEKYPTITFQTKSAKKEGENTVLVGDFTMHGVTKSLSLPVKVKGPIKDPWGNMRIGLEGNTKISRKDFGLTYNKALETGGLVVGEEVEIQINAEAVRPPG
jgi:polyisoprenoid-binding protein YceI